MKEAKDIQLVHVRLEEPSLLRKEILDSALLLAKQKKKYGDFKKAREEKSQALAELKGVIIWLKRELAKIALAELPEEYLKKLPGAPKPLHKFEAYKARQASREEKSIDEEIEELRRKIEQL